MDEQKDEQLEICEVAARDGLQSLGAVWDVNQRVEFISTLYEAGLQKLEVGALVHPKAVPQMHGSDKVFLKIAERYPENHANFSLLIPNEYGLNKAHQMGCDYVAFFTATSETFNNKNIRMGVDESIERISQMLEKLDQSVKTRLYISTVFHCPYEGEKKPPQELERFEPLFETLDEISLGDTTGRASKLAMDQLLEWLENKSYKHKIWLHLHNTHGKALDHINTAMNWGYRKFDSSAAGLGGCPFAPGAPGNVSTEEILELAQRRGLPVPVQPGELRQAIARHAL